MVQGQGYVGRAQLGPGEEGDRGSPEQIPAEGLAGLAAAAPHILHCNILSEPAATIFLKTDLVQTPVFVTYSDIWS